jgi:hypothetical protein
MLGADGRIQRDMLMPAVYEVDAAANLLGTGIQLVLAQGISVHDPSSMFATLATGAEKLLKLSFGLMSLDDNGAWPSVDTMRGKYRHAIVSMHRVTLEGMRSRAASAPQFLIEQVDTVDNDVRSSRIITCLDDYAKRGRFHDLDTLADGAPPSAESPRQLWEAVELDVLKAEPDILTALGSPEFKTVGRPRLNGVMAESLTRWWQLHHIVWTRGAFGRAAQLLSAQLSPPRQR